ncbi:uncharacterized protein LOC135224530 [Macrobrachium nipponense]|uniref:uncharacterized protein LOC135224530 n=1 Tax=Macrobrachium nipponense TaxID=159736 RepID=UPI0030C8572F
MESFMKEFVLSLTKSSDESSKSTDIANSIHNIVVRGNSGHICKAEIIIPMKSSKIAELIERNRNCLLYSCLTKPSDESFSNTKKVLTDLDIPLQKIFVEKNLLCFSLIRDEMIKSALTVVIGAGQHYGQSRILHSKKVVITHDTSSNKTDPVDVYRGHVILSHIINSLKFAGAEVQTVHHSEKEIIRSTSGDCSEPSVNHCEEENLSKIYLRRSGKSLACDDVNWGDVLKYRHLISTEAGKAWKVSAENLCKIMVDELKAAMELKYGSVAGKEAMDFLGKEAHHCMTLFLLSKTYSDDLRVDTSDNAQNTKEWAFVLYNYARLKMIFRSFESKVSDGLLSPLPDIKEIDFSLLKQDEEWTLVWEYVIRWPEIIEEFATAFVKNPTKIKTSTVVKFLNALSHRFSIYYRRFRVLVSGEFPHLIPLMYSRLYFFKSIMMIMDICFDLLGVDSPPECM